MKLIVQPGRLILMREKLTETLLGKDARALGELVYARARAEDSGIVVAPFESSETELFMDPETALKIGSLLQEDENSEAGSRAEYEISLAG